MDVTVVEAEPQILPLYDRRLTMPLGRKLKSLGVEVLTDARLVRLTGPDLDRLSKAADDLGGLKVCEASTAWQIDLDSLEPMNEYHLARWRLRQLTTD